jgi:predicted metal-dependent hydrolase
MKIPFKGGELALVLERGPMNDTRIRLDGQRLVVRVSSIYGDPEGACKHVTEKVTQWLKGQARLAISLEIERQRENFKFEYKDLRIKDTKSRWGSCSSAGNLNFSWRLILAKPEAIQYLVTHETAHLSEMNHSKEFWKLVDSRMANHEAVKGYLKAEGRRLMAWQLPWESLLEQARQLWK